MNVFYMDFKWDLYIKESIVYLIHTVPPRPSPSLLFGFKFEPRLNYKYRAVEYTCTNAQLVFACWQAWIWLSWPAWTWFLTGLFMHVGTDCSWLDERTDLNNVVGTIMINQQPCSYMVEHVVREWWNNKIEQRCYNNYELGCCIKSGFACSNIREQPLSIRQAV